MLDAAIREWLDHYFLVRDMCEQEENLFRQWHHLPFTLVVCILLLTSYASLTLGWVAPQDLVFFSELRVQAMFSEPWRWLSPLLLHHDLIHVSTNLICWVEFARQLERRHGTLFLVSFTGVIGVLSSIIELLMADNRFGGLSGVVLGAASYIGVHQWLKKGSAPWHFPPIYGMALLVMVVFDATGHDGNASIWVHLSGVVAGGVLALVMVRRERDGSLPIGR